MKSFPSEPIDTTPTPDLKIDFELIWLACLRNWRLALAAFGVVLGLATFAASSRSPTYSARGILLFRIDQTPLLTGIGVESSELSPLAVQSNPLLTETAVLLSEPLISQVIEDLDLRNEEGEFLSARSIQERLSVIQAGTADVLELSFQGEDPETPAKVVNRLMDVYLVNTLERSRNEAISAQEFLATQIPAAEEALINVEEQLRQFRESEDVLNLEFEAEAYIEAVAEFDRILARYEDQLASIQSRIGQIEQQLGMTVQKALAVSKVSQAPGIQSALEEMQAVESELALNLTRFQPNSPVILGLQERLIALQQLLEVRVRELVGSTVIVDIQDLQAGDLERALIEELSELEVERLGITSSIESIQANRSSTVADANRFPNLDQRQRQIERELEAIQSSYQSLLASRERLNLAEKQGVVNASILERASISLKPDLDVGSVFLVLAGIIFGGISAVSVIFVREVANPTVKTTKRLQHLFDDYPLMGSIPNFSLAKKWLKPNQKIALPLQDVPNSPLSEMYRQLQAALELRTSIDYPITIVVASSVPGEGKSTTAANLAIAMAETERPVLLIDADLRNPTQAKLWGLPTFPGLAETISGKLQIEDTINSVKPFLDVLVAGDLDVNPNSLLQSPHLATLLKMAASAYDLIIVDTPSLAVASDALILGNLSDGLLLVAKPGLVDRKSGAAINTAIKNSKQNVIGLVMNAIDATRTTDNYFKRLQDLHNRNNLREPK